jgi:chromate reductase, NAD(P)H dehydrogenase (quinone)
MLLICAGSNGKNLELAQRLAELGSELGVPCELLDVVSLGWPIYTPTQQEKGPPDDFERVAALFHRATAYLLCAPEYNGSIPPSITSLIAWLSVADEDFRALFNGKQAAIASHSGGAGQKVMVAMRLMFSHLGANVLGREMLCNSQKSLNEETARQLLQQLGRDQA